MTNAAEIDEKVMQSETASFIGGCRSHNSFENPA